MLTILVVDDDATVRNLLDQALQVLGIHVLTACDVIEAESLFRKHAVSVLLLDIEMPGIDGPETLKRLRAIRPIACVFMTAGSSHSRDEILALGACDVIRKPFRSLNALVEVLKGCFESERVKTSLPQAL